MQIGDSPGFASFLWFWFESFLGMLLNLFLRKYKCLGKMFRRLQIGVFYKELRQMKFAGSVTQACAESIMLEQSKL